MTRFWWLDRWVIQARIEGALARFGKWLEGRIRLPLWMRGAFCSLFMHDWQPSPNEMILLSVFGDGGDYEPYGVFVRCQRCKEPDPLWPYDWYPDEEEA